ncbi:MAG: rod shape-determining protein RodA [Solitalea-like symbiont of Acarus siro]
MDRLYERKEKTILLGIDKTIFFTYLILVFIGWINIYATTQGHSTKFLDINSNVTKQLIWILLSFVAIIVILLVDGRWFNLFSYTYYIITLILLVGVIFIGHTVAGNKGWFDIAGFRLQPAEFAKVTTCLALAKYINTQRISLAKNKKIIAYSLLIIIIPMALIILQPDVGSAITYISLILVLYREGLSSWILILLIWIALLFVLAITIPQATLIIFLTIIFALGVYIARRRTKSMILAALIGILSILFTIFQNYVFNNLLKQHHRDRIEVLFGKRIDNKGIGYNINQSKIAIGSGRLFGKGYLEGTQTKYSFVPEQSTDFIFCTIGEEWGFIGSTITILLYTIMLFRIINIAEKQYFIFSRIYSYCVAAFIFFHVVINIGMTIGIFPVIGIPLPFISYGGSSLLSFTILIFIMLKLDIINKKHLFS